MILHIRAQKQLHTRGCRIRQLLGFAGEIPENASAHSRCCAVEGKPDEPFYYGRGWHDLRYVSQKLTNEDGSVNWLPVCGDSQGFVMNKALFDDNNIPVPTDYDSFVYACQTFEELGVRGYAGDLCYDYNCLSILQGLSIPELTSLKGRKWRTAYEDPASDATIFRQEETEEK